MQDNGVEVTQAIKAGTAKAVSDGSYLQTTGNGAAGYVLLGTFISLRIEGSLIVPGCHLDMSAYRSKPNGPLYGISCVLEDLCSHYKILSGHVTIDWDGQEALWQAIGSSSPISQSASDFDLVAAIRKKIQELPISTSMQWIKGHQDSSPAEEKLDLWARLNISMDILAKQCRTSHDCQPNLEDQRYDIKGALWQLFLDGVEVSKNLQFGVFEHCATPALAAHWSE